MRRLLYAVLIAVLALAGESPAQIYSLQQTFLNPTLQDAGLFGISVALVGDKVLVGASDNDTGAPRSGAAYLFDGVTGNLLQTFEKPGVQSMDDRFGSWVAAAGNNVLIGAPGVNGGAGEAYLFDTDGNLLHTFANPNPVANFDQFGTTVAWVDGKAVIGAPSFNIGAAAEAGRVCVFDGAAGWSLLTIPNPTPASGDMFGFAIAGLGGNILVSATQDDNAKGSNAGAVHLIDSDTGALLNTILNPSAAGTAQDRFGWSIAANSNYILIGAPQRENGAISNAGAAFLFDATTLDWLYELPDPTPSFFESFGVAVALTDDHALVGAPFGNNGAGEVNIFDPVTGDHLPPTLSDPSPSSNEAFGWRLAAAGNRIVVGAFREGISDESLGYGAAYLFSSSSNAPPQANAGEDQTAECSSPAGTPVTLDGSGSSDPDGDELTYTWHENGNPEPIATGVSPVVTLALGSHTLILTVDDGNGGTDTDEVIVTVEDTTPPTITLQPAITLWPPNHKYASLSIAQMVASVSDACTGTLPLSGVRIAAVSSDEPEDAPDAVCTIDDPLHVCYNGDGSTTNDVVIASDCGSVQLRKERAASGNGRVYTINVEVSDEHGNVATAAFKAAVPHDQSGNPAVENTPCYTMASACSMPKLAGSQENVSDESLPAGFAIFQNYPNPFNPETEIRFQLPEASHVTVMILNTLGEAIRTLAEGEFAAGTHSVRWNAQNERGVTVPSGVYFYQVSTPRFNALRRMVLIK